MFNQVNNSIVQVNSPTTIKAAKQTDAKLGLIEDILQALHKHNIKYCHWKSNEHLAASMRGSTDLDILFAEREKTAVEIVLDNHGLKKFIPIKEKQYRDIEDFIGLDLPSGKIVHVHAHFKLTLGECYLKGYQLNLENKILDSRVFDIEFGIYRSAPVFELVLLYFRHALKLRNRDIVNFYFNKDISYNENILAEYRWLKLRCTNDEIEALLKSLFPDFIAIYYLVTKDFSHKVLLALSRLLHKTLKSQRLYSPVTATLFRWYREIAIKAYRKWSKFTGRPVIQQRIHPHGGLSVAIIGADGSGKSTVIENLQSTFKKKIDVYTVYMGRGKTGKISWQRKVLNLFRKQYSKHQPLQKTKEDIFSKDNRTFRFNLFKCAEALAVAREKRKKLKLIQAAKAKGMLVICDRFPQNQSMGYNDGPALNYLLQSGNVLFRLLARKEARTYRLAEDNPPDIVFKLVADAEVIAERKPSKASREMLELKIEGIKRLKFADNCNTVTIDANRPLNDVLGSIKGQLWAAWA